MKHEWKKQEKIYYLPKNRPTEIDIPAFNFFSIRGEGNPNNESFAEYIGVLYSLSYAVKMSSKAGLAPENYYEYTVYPLEGVWDISEEAKNKQSDKLDKDSLVFNLMMRQPDFVKKSFVQKTIERTKIKKPHDLLDMVKFECIAEGKCIQMLHLGSYDSEPESFEQMQQFANQNNLKRKYKFHREIYLSDARKVAPEKLKTVLRFQVE